VYLGGFTEGSDEARSGLWACWDGGVRVVVGSFVNGDAGLKIMKTVQAFDERERGACRA